MMKLCMCTSMLYYSISAHMHVHVCMHAHIQIYFTCMQSSSPAVYSQVRILYCTSYMHAHAHTHTHMHTCTHAHTLRSVCENCLLKTLNWRAVKRMGTRVMHMPAGAMSCLSLNIVILYCNCHAHTSLPSRLAHGWLTGMAGFIRGRVFSVHVIGFYVEVIASIFFIKIILFNNTS